MSSVRKRTLPSGEIRWQVDYKDQAGKRRSKQFGTKAEAVSHETKVRSEISTGTHVADSASVTISKAADLWVQRAELDELEASTIRQYKQHRDLHIVPEIGAVKLSRLTKPDVERFKDKMLETRSRSLARAILTSLKGILKEAQRRGLVGQNVASDTQVRVSSRDEEEVVIPTRDHIRLILTKVTKQWRPLITTAVFSGLRCSELRGLTWAHVDLKAGMIKVRQRADFQNTMGSPKSRAGRRDVPIGPMVVNVLKTWKLECPTGEKNPLDLVFPTKNGTIHTNSNIWKYCWAPLQRDNGMTHPRPDDADEKTPADPLYTFHALRHAAASLFIEQGWSPKKVQAVMGHSSITVTFDTYGHLWPDLESDQSAVAEIERNLLRPATAAQ